MKDYKTIGEEKRAANALKIPREWRLDAKYLDKVNAESDMNVLGVPSTCGILSEQELHITQRYDATDLVERLASTELTSYNVTLAFCKRAAVAHQLVNCLTEIMFDEALKRAKECDEYLATHKKTMGPLHGLPISLKDSFVVKGFQATIGYVAFASNPPAQSNSSLVDLLLAAGAVLYVKTNLPQTMMAADCDNNLFGRTLNPNKLSLTAGGSTGGEGALLKLRGSVLGVATDIAGSIRIPALCNGLFGFKPTSGRPVGFWGKVAPGRLGSPSPILPVIGPVGHSVRDMELFLRAVIDSEPWTVDDGCLAIPWRRVDAPKRKLRLGLILEDSKRPLHPAMMRTMKSAEAEFTKAGHTIVNMDDEIPSMYDTSVLSWKFFSLDPRKTALKFIEESGEPLIPGLISYTELQGWEPTLDELFDMNSARRKVMRHYHNILVENDLDGFMMPPYQATAVPHDQYGIPVYTVLANLLDASARVGYPAVSIPYLAANAELDKEFVRADVPYEPPYVADAVEGAPSGIQIVGKPMKDEELMHMMRIISDVLKAKT